MHSRALRLSRLPLWVSADVPRASLKRLRKKFSVRELASVCDLSVKAVYSIMSSKRQRVYLAAALAIAAAEASSEQQEKEKEGFEPWLKKKSA